jgi:hypothetical protein
MSAGVVLAFTSAVLAPSAMAASGGLAGRWTSVDTDGSHQTLDIRGSGSRAYAVVYVDDSATSVCGGAPARISGPGYVDGDSLVAVGVLVCLPGGNVLRERLAIGYQYDAATDTLTDDFGILWHRAS